MLKFSEVRLKFNSLIKTKQNKGINKQKTTKDLLRGTTDYATDILVTNLSLAFKKLHLLVQVAARLKVVQFNRYYIISF